MKEELILQHVILPDREICDEEKLYYRQQGEEKSGLLSWPISMREGQLIGFDTYFNSFSLEKWYTYTSLDDLQLVVEFEGCFEINLFQFSLSGKGAPTPAVNQRLVSSNILDTPARQGFRLHYAFEDHAGVAAFQIRALKDGGRVYGAYYATETDKEDISRVRLALGICTYKREEFVRKNLKNLDKSFFGADSPIKEPLEVFIADNAGTLNIPDYLNARVHVFPQRDVGASGGFSRAMLEVIRANRKGAGFTHVVIMDDDIVFEPEAIYRTCTLLSLIREEYRDAFVGGAMLKLGDRAIQFERGGAWRLDKLRSFSINNHGFDLRDLRKVLENELPVETTWQGWYYCAVPLTICRADNLIFPMVMKVDDLEYSARNLSHVIFLNGVNVWHETGGAKYTSANEAYYWPRNYLIFAALHQPLLTKEHYLEYFRARAQRYIFSFSYQEMRMLAQAVQDFLGGVDRIKEIDIEDQFVSLLKAGYKLQDTSKFPVYSKSLFVRTAATPYPPSKIRRAFRVATMNGLLLPSRKTVAVEIGGGTKIQSYRAKKVIRVIPSSKKGFILKRSLPEFVRCSRLYFDTQKLLRDKLDWAIQDYRSRYRELIGEEFWSNKF